MEMRPSKNIRFREKNNGSYIWDLFINGKPVYNYVLSKCEDRGWNLCMVSDIPLKEYPLSKCLEIKKFESEEEALDNYKKYLLKPNDIIGNSNFSNPVKWVLVIEDKQGDVRYYPLSHEYEDIRSAESEAENIADRFYKETDLGWSVRPYDISSEDIPPKITDVDW